MVLRTLHFWLFVQDDNRDDDDGFEQHVEDLCLHSDMAWKMRLLQQQQQQQPGHLIPLGINTHIIQ